MKSPDTPVAVKPTPWREMAQRASVVVVAQCCLQHALRRLSNTRACASRVTRSPDLELNVISLLRASALSAFGAWKCMQRQWDTVNSIRDMEDARTVAIGSLGYFIHDWLSMILQRTKGEGDSTMHAHHALSVAITATALRAPSMFTLVAPMCLIEISSIFLNAISVLKAVHGVRATTMRRVQLMFAATFFLTRMMWMPYITSKYMNRQSSLPSARAFLICLNLMNVHWFGKIVDKISLS